MLRLKLREEFDQVLVCLSLENPLTGARNILDAKIDTGAVVTLVPMHLVSEMGLEVIGETDLVMANGSVQHAYVALALVVLSDEDIFEIPVYVCKAKTDVALIGMDILHQCNYSQQHEWSNGEHYINFEIELAEMPE